MRYHTGLMVDHVVNIIEGASHAYCLNVPLNTSITINWKVARIKTRSQIATGEYLKAIGDWLALRAHRRFYIWVIENLPEGNYHTHILLHVPVELWRSFRKVGRHQNWLKALGANPEAWRTGSQRVLKIDYLNLFGGMAFCNECSAPMRFRNSGSKRSDHFLVCSNRVESARESEKGRCQHRRHYQAAPFERAFLQFLEEIDLSIFDDGRRHSLDKLVDKIASVELDLAAKQNELKRWMDAFGREDVDAPKARIRDLDQEVRGLARQLPDLKERLTREQATAMTAQEHVLTIGRLKERMKRAEGDERYAIRAQLAQEIRRVVETIWFGHPKCDCLVYVHASSDPNLHPAYFLQRVKIGRRVTWECLRVPTQDNMNGMRLVRREAGTHAAE
jgi:hypothetical protein